MLAALLDAVLPAGLPPRWRTVLDLDAAAPHLEDFKVGPVLAFGADRPVRLAVSDRGENDAWVQRVAEAWPHRRAAPFLRRLPDARRMVDSDGSERAVLYLDDLQDVPHTLPGPTEAPLMAVTLSIPEGVSGFLTRHTTLPPRARRWVGELAAAPGLWSLRFDERRLAGVLWISEARWRGDAEAATARILHRAPPAWHKLAEVTRALGLLAYPDAVEVLADGTWDVTAGFVARPPAP